MDSIQVRLELIKLVYKHQEKPENAVASAKVLEEYVLRSKEAGAPLVQPQNKNQGKHDKK